MELIKKHLDKIFDLFRQAGITNRFDAIYQITCLLYLKSLEDIELVKGRDYLYVDSVFTGHEQYKWSELVLMEPQVSHVLFNTEILPFLGKQPLGIQIDALHNSFHPLISDQIFYLLLTSIDQMFHDALEGKQISRETIGLYGEIYDCMMTYLVTISPKTLVLLTPKYLQRLICQLAQLKDTDTVYDPAMGVGNLLVEANHDLLVNASPKYKLTEDEDGFPTLRNFAEVAMFALRGMKWIFNCDSFAR